MSPRTHLVAPLLLGLLLVGGLFADPEGLRGSARFRGPCGWLNEVLGEWSVPRQLNGRSPMRWWRRARFEEACTDLRRCYTTLGSERAACERRMRELMERECDEVYSGQAEEPARQRCRLAARLVHRAVRERGEPLWRDAQYEALHLEQDEDWPAVRRSQKWQVGYPAPPLRVPTRYQAAGAADALGR